MPINNAAYSSEFILIETVFSLVKMNVKKKRLNIFIKKGDEDLKKTIRKEFDIV